VQGIWNKAEGLVMLHLESLIGNHRLRYVTRAHFILSHLGHLFCRILHLLGVLVNDYRIVGRLRELLGFTVQSNSRNLISIALRGVIENRNSILVLKRLTRRYKSSSNFLVVTGLLIRF
jgi:hypothetical protein